jgi:hypothetical protein
MFLIEKLFLGNFCVYLMILFECRDLGLLLHHLRKWGIFFNAKNHQQNMFHSFFLLLACVFRFFRNNLQQIHSGADFSFSLII